MNDKPTLHNGNAESIFHAADSRGVELQRYRDYIIGDQEEAAVGLAHYLASRVASAARARGAAVNLADESLSSLWLQNGDSFAQSLARQPEKQLAVHSAAIGWIRGLIVGAKGAGMQIETADLMPPLSAEAISNEFEAHDHMLDADLNTAPAMHRPAIHAARELINDLSGQLEISKESVTVQPTEEVARDIPALGFGRGHCHAAALFLLRHPLANLAAGGVAVARDGIRPAFNSTGMRPDLPG